MVKLSFSTSLINRIVQNDKNYINLASFFIIVFLISKSQTILRGINVYYHSVKRASFVVWKYLDTTFSASKTAPPHRGQLRRTLASLMTAVSPGPTDLDLKSKCSAQQVRQQISPQQKGVVEHQNTLLNTIKFDFDEQFGTWKNVHFNPDSQYL